MRLCDRFIYPNFFNKIMNENKNPKGIKVIFFKKSKHRYYLCPNCYEYLMYDECLKCGLICDIEENERFNQFEHKTYEFKDLQKIMVKRI